MYYADCLALLDAIIDYILFLLTLGQEIRLVRLDNNCTQERFAELLEVDVTTVQRWEADKQVPRDRLLMQIKKHDFNDRIMIQAERGLGKSSFVASEVFLSKNAASWSCRND